MNTQLANEDKIRKILRCCSDAYLRHGHRLKFPNNTDPTKTYNWRYLSSMAKKFEEWDFDDETASRFINVAIDYAAEKKLAYKGLAVLHQNNMMEVCYKRLKALQDDGQHHVGRLREEVNLLRTLGKMDADKLLKRRNLDSFTFMTEAYLGGKLTQITFALSKACYTALVRLSKIDEVERRMLPKFTELFMLRKHFCNESENVLQAKRILGTDWRHYESRGSHCV